MQSTGSYPDACVNVHRADKVAETGSFDGHMRLIWGDKWWVALLPNEKYSGPPLTPHFRTAGADLH